MLAVTPGSNRESPYTTAHPRTPGIETTPLVSHYGVSIQGRDSANGEDLLGLAIFEQCIGDTPLLDLYRGPRKIALAVSTAASLSAGVAFIPVSLELPAGPAFAAANFIGFFKLDMWAIRGTINDLLGPKGAREIALLDRTANGKCLNGAVTTASTVVALLSQVPVALPSLDYDGKLKIPAVICLFVGGVLIPVRSLQLTINKTMRVRNNHLGEAGKRIENLRMTMESMIGQHREIFRKMDRVDQLEHINRLKGLQGTDIEQARGLIEEVLKEPLAERQEVQGRSFLGHCSRAVGLWIAGSLQTGLTIYTFAKTKEHIIDNDIIAGALAGSVVLSGAYLSGQSIINTTESISGSFLNFIRGKREKAIAEQLRPKLTQSLKLLSLIIDVGALGATIVIWGDFYKDNLPAKVYFESTLCLAYFLFLSTATLDMVDEVVEELIQRTGNHEEQQIVHLSNQLKKMQALIERSSILDFSVFVEGCSEDLKTKLLDRVNLTIEALDESIQMLNARRSDLIL